MKMKPKGMLSFAKQFVWISILVFGFRWWSDKRDDYRPVYTQFGNDGSEYCFVGAIDGQTCGIRPLLWPYNQVSNDVATVESVLMTNAISHSLHDPGIVELWVAKADVDRTKELFNKNEKGILRRSQGPRSIKDKCIDLVLIVFGYGVVFLLGWLYEHEYDKKRNEIVQDWIAENAERATKQESTKSLRREDAL